MIFRRDDLKGNRNRPVPEVCLRILPTSSIFSGFTSKKQKMHLRTHLRLCRKVKSAVIFMDARVHVRFVSICSQFVYVFIMKKQKRPLKQKLLVSETCKLELKGKCLCFLIGGLIASKSWCCGLRWLPGTFLWQLA